MRVAVFGVLSWLVAYCPVCGGGSQLELYTLYGNELNVIGLRYPSSLDPDAECWAIWDTGEHLVSTYDVAPIDFTNTSLRAAAERLGLTLPSTWPPTPTVLRAAREIYCGNLGRNPPKR